MLHINLTFAISFARFACGIPASCKFAYTVRAVHAKKKVIGLHETLHRRQFKEYYGFSALPIKFNYASATARQPIRLTLKVARLDFLGGYLPSLSINYVAMSKDMEKRFPQLYYIKMKNSYDLGFIAIGVAMAT